MQYLYHKEALESQIELGGDEHRYIFKVRRHRIGDLIYLRNLEDDFIYKYLITDMSKTKTELELIDMTELIISSPRYLHIAWCVIDPKSIEKVLPSLNEIGVSKISFVYCNRSQKSFKLDFNRYNKILLNSSQQCGRSKMMDMENVKDLSTLLQTYPDTHMLNFSRDNFICSSYEGTILIGCEGGFTTEEMELFDTDNIIGLDTPLILKSESATIAVASKVLL